MIDVVLSDAEVVLYRAVARARRESALTNRRPDRYGFSGDNSEALSIDYKGTGGELAASIALGLPWCGCYFRTLPQTKAPDVGTNLEVRTVSKPHHRLIVHDHDPNDWYAVSVLQTGEATFTIRGIILCERAKEVGKWEDPQGKNRWAYFVDTKHFGEIRDNSG